MIEIPSAQILAGSIEESQVDTAMSNKNDGDFESDMNENTSSWLKSDSFWNN